MQIMYVHRYYRVRVFRRTSWPTSKWPIVIFYGGGRFPVSQIYVRVAHQPKKTGGPSSEGKRVTNTEHIIISWRLSCCSLIG